MANVKVVEAVAEITKVGKKKSHSTGDLLMDIAYEVESLDKAKAMKEADKLAENVEVNYFRMGGVLKLINDNSWFDGYASFDAFVIERFGFASRKARYLISIYDNLVTKSIPWEKVSGLGWSKLKELAPILTQDNVDEWVTKASALSLSELRLVIKKVDVPDTTEKTSDGLVKMKFNFKADQADIVQQALAKAKGELPTEYDTVALENICLGYVGGNSSVQKSTTFAEHVISLGFETAMNQIAEMFPEWDIDVKHAVTAAA